LKKGKIPVNKERHAYTVMVVPERKGRTAFSFRISRRRVIFLSVCVGIAIISMGILIYKSVEAAKKLSYFYTLSRENDDLKKENCRLRLIHEKIGKMDTIVSYLGKLARVHGGKAEYAGIVSDQSTKEPGTIAQGALKDTLKAGKTDIHQDPGDSFAKRRDSIEKKSRSVPLQLPVEGWVTQSFIGGSANDKGKHLGIDIAAAEGKSIKAPASGTVISVSKDQYYGVLLVIRHDNNYVTRYGHCQKVFVSNGEKVERDQLIALVGNTGHSTAPHLHYEVLKKGKQINPMELLPSIKK
jgi:murein DD-endopeptidase MepM/ murein hydrolase activator NlpD